MWVIIGIIIVLLVPYMLLCSTALIIQIADVISWIRSYR